MITLFPVVVLVFPKKMLSFSEQQYLCFKKYLQKLIECYKNDSMELETVTMHRDLN